MSACPERRLLLHALLDDELAPGDAVVLAAHAETCAGCGAELARLRTLQGALAAADLTAPVPDAFQARALAALVAEETQAGIAPGLARRSRRLPVPQAWAAGAAVAAAFALFAILPASQPGLSRDLVDGHVRALQAQHLVDVPTSDRHVVKPWFNGKLDFAPPVVDLADQGFPLVGGRLDTIDGRTVAALVYRRRAHVINLFIWRGAAPAGALTRRLDGYNLVRWSRGGLTFWAVSDLEAGELTGFSRNFLARTA